MFMEDSSYFKQLLMKFVSTSDHPRLPRTGGIAFALIPVHGLS